jgi:hypothetical protein
MDNERKEYLGDENKKSYLGDAVYATYDGFHIVLTADANIIYLDPNVCESLLHYIRKIHGGA